ncbi:hypothetical protein CCR85_12160 [Rhodothalassium salexigens]|uniref:hypothetical protein n=1 Tax=Rhodothalassium salexigens TaxID=1086 RepID=UPI0019147810|nr:hypothetical protein [Rhodothalassium salexigens]MBK5912243.1 hypothetical protein [Rhodothalassium salexigens]
MTKPDTPTTRAIDRDRQAKLLAGYQLATAEILYRLPDHPSFLQTFVWQDFDLVPRYPVLKRFLAFWEDNLDGALHSVRVTSAKVLTTGDWRTDRDGLVLP